MNTPISLDGACRLEGLGAIRAGGADAATFLQGQLTNDVAGLSESKACLAGFCSAKGRLQASFMVWRESPESFVLVCSKDLLAGTLKRLSMFVMRAKCRLSDASDEISLWGLAGASATARLDGTLPWQRHEHAGQSIVRLPDAEGVTRAMVAAPSADTSVPSSAPVLGLDAWRWLDVRSGIVTIEAATVDRFVPQMVNFELVGGVDFKKGCYPGQEVVARSQYRGTTKRRTFLFESDTLPRPGDDVFAGVVDGATSEAVGTVATAAEAPDGGVASALIEVRLAALGSDLHLGASSGPRLRQVELPYPVAIEAEPAL